VLLTIEDYRRLTAPTRNILEILAIPDGDDFELELPERTIDMRVIDL